MMKSCLLALGVCASVAAFGGIELPPLVSDRMVLQAETKAPVWGRCEPGAKVTVSFRGKSAAAKADADGAWRVAELPNEVPGSDWNGGQRWDGYEIAKTKGVYLLVNSDLSSGVHPPIKSAYAERGFRIALANAYGEKVEWTGPRFKALRLKGDRIAISFTHADSGLAVPKGAKLQGFALAGEDGRYIWAEGEIHGKGVLLKVPAGLEPKRVKYAMAWPNAWATLFNKEGFPALGFEADVK